MLISTDIQQEPVSETIEQPPKKSKFHFETGARFELLFLAAFSLTAPFIPNTIMLHVLKGAVNPAFSLLFSILAYLGFAVCLTLYMKKTTDENQVQSKGDMANSILSSAAGILLLYLITLIFAFIYKNLIGFVPALANMDAKAAVFLSIQGGSILLLLMLLFSAVVLTITVIRYGTPLNGIGGMYRIVMKGLLRSLLSVVFYSLLAGILLYGVNILQNISLDLLSSFLQPGFYRNFIFYTLGACINGLFFLVLIRFALKLMSKMEDQIIEQNSKTSKAPVPVFAIAIAILCAVFTVLIAPVGANAADGILAEVALHHEKGDIARSMNLSQKAIYEYDLAYSKLLSLKGYLQGVKTIKEKSPVTQEMSNSNMKEAARLSLKNPYVPYFRGRLLLENGNPDGAIDAFKTAILYRNGIVESYFGLLEAYNQKGQEAQLKDVLQLLDNTEVYRDNLGMMKNFSTGKIDRILSKIEDVEKVIGPKMVYKSIEKLKYNDAPGALSEIIALQKLYPKDPMISYQIARTANEYRSESSNYATVREFATVFDTQSESSGMTEDGAGRKLFVAQMYEGADDLGAAEKVLSEAYAEYPADAEIARQYAYILNRGNRGREALEVLDNILSKNPQDLEAIHLSALAQLIQKNPAESLKLMNRLIETAGKDTAATTMLDRQLYSYCLTFYKTFPGAEIQTEVERYKNNGLLYHYLNAIKGWKDHDSELSNSHISEVIALRPDLGYAYYIMGINHYENTVRTGGTDFAKAASYYQQSLKLLPAHAEGYFALGHCYKKWGRNLEALRAFRKVTDLMPYEDHRVDPYGMTVHAASEVRELAQYDIKEVN